MEYYMLVSFLQCASINLRQIEDNTYDTYDQ